MSYTKEKSLLSPEQKKAKIAKIREDHKEALDHFKVENKDFNVKTKWMKNNQMIIGLFDNELVKENGLYFELVNFDLDPISDERTLYKFNPVDNYMDVYEVLSSGAYAVPLEEVDVVTVPGAKPKKTIVKTQVDKSTFNVDNIMAKSKDDCSVDGMSIRDLASILWKKPVSNKKWLNSMIEDLNK